MVGWLARDPSRAADHVRRHRASLELVRQRGYSVAAGSEAQRSLGAAASDLADVPGRAELRSDSASCWRRWPGRPLALDALEPHRTFDIGVVAAPVFDADGAVVAAISATGFPPGRAAGQILAIAEAVRDTAAVVTRESRGRAPA